MTFHRLLATVALFLAASGHAASPAAAASPPAAAGSTSVGEAPPISPEAEIGTAGAEVLRGAELLARAADGLAQQREAYEASLQRLGVQYRRATWSLLQERHEALLDERALQIEAGVRGVSTLEVLRDVKSAPVTPDEVRAFFESNAGSFQEPFDAVAPRIAQFLMEQRADAANRAFFAELRARHRVRGVLQPLREDVAASGAARGPETAPVLIVEFADFQCPYCAKSRVAVDEVFAEYPGMIRHVFRHMPIIHPNAQIAAEAAVCADRQGTFWPVRDRFFERPTELTADRIRAAVRDLGLDTEAFEACVADPATAREVARDLDDATRLAVSGTPGYFVNGRHFNGALTVEQLRGIVDEELARSAYGVRPADAPVAGISTTTSRSP